MMRMRGRHAGSLAGLATMVVAVVLFAKKAVMPSIYGVCTVGHDYRERPIYWFGASTSERKCGNDVGGRRPGKTYSGGEGVACGRAVRPGEQAIVKWTFDRPLSEIEKHVLDEMHEVQVMVPQPESRKSRYLQVHFLADNHVVLDWRDEVDNRVNTTTERVNG